LKSGSIHVAVGRVCLDLPGVGSLKEKRKVIRPLVKRLRDRFGVSASEVGHQDVWHSSVIAVAAVGGDRAGLDGLVQDAMRFVQRRADAVVVDLRVEIVDIGEIHSGPEPGGDGTDSAAASIEEKWLVGEEE
jgi:uncharacterized protein YlxP (DUF503 family)